MDKLIILFKEMRLGDRIAAVSGIAVLVSFFIPTIDVSNDSMFSAAISGGAEEKILFLYLVVGILMLGGAYKMHKHNLPRLAVCRIVPDCSMLVNELQNMEGVL